MCCVLGRRPVAASTTSVTTLEPSERVTVMPSPPSSRESVLAQLATAPRTVHGPSTSCTLNPVRPSSLGLTMRPAVADVTSSTSESSRLPCSIRASDSRSSTIDCSRSACRLMMPRKFFCDSPTP